MKETVTRASRDRRVIALMAWAGLVFTSFSLWNSRMSGFIRVVAAEPVAFILAAFGAFVGVFAWMLYNPGRRSAAESPGLFLAMGATLFPPPVIGFCLMPPSSPLRWWLAVGIFLLCVIAVLSHVPDEFFGVPRGRHTYLIPVPAFDRVEDTIMDPNADWFAFSDISSIVPDTERPSLAPRAYLQRETVRPAPPVPRTTLMPVSDVDDILGMDLDIDLLAGSELDDDFPEFTEPDRPPSDRPMSDRPMSDRPMSYRLNSDRRNSDRLLADSRYTDDRDSDHETPEPARSMTTRRVPLPRITEQASIAHVAYAAFSPANGGLEKRADTHRSQSARSYSRHRNQSRKERLAESLQVDRSGNRGRNDLPTVTGPQSSANRPAPPPADIGRPSVTKAPQETKGQRIDSGQPVSHVSPSRKRQSRKGREPESTPVSAEQTNKSVTAEIETVARANPESGRKESYRRKGRRDRAQQTHAPASQSPAVQGFQATTTAPQQGVTSQVTESQAAAVDPAQSPATQSRADTSRLIAEAPAPDTPVQIPSRRKGRQLPELERTTDEFGSELVEGVMRVRFDKGQKRANLHVPFSPPLPGMPEVECECVGGENLRLKVPVRQSYGIRIEARRSNADHPLEAEVGFAAVYTPE